MFSGLQTVAQATSDYSTYSSTTDSSTDAAIALAVMTPLLLFFLVFTILSIIGMWKMFTKAGKPGWAALIPIYNMVVWCQIVGRPAWWVVLLFIPGVNVVISVILCLDLAKAFGKDTLYGILIYLFQPIMFMVLGFGKDQYVGPVAEEGVTPAPAGVNAAGQPVPPANETTASTSTQESVSSPAPSPSTPVSPEPTTPPTNTPPTSAPDSEENIPPKVQ